MHTGGGGGWTALESDDLPLLSVTFNTPMHITHVVSQGHASREEWVTQYQVSYRLSFGENHLWVRDEQGQIQVSLYQPDYHLVLRNLKVSNYFYTNLGRFIK